MQARFLKAKLKIQLQPRFCVCFYSLFFWPPLAFFAFFFPKSSIKIKNKGILVRKQPAKPIKQLNQAKIIKNLNWKIAAKCFFIVNNKNLSTIFLKIIAFGYIIKVLDKPINILYVRNALKTLPKLQIQFFKVFKAIIILLQQLLTTLIYINIIFIQH